MRKLLLLLLLVGIASCLCSQAPDVRQTSILPLSQLPGLPQLKPSVALSESQLNTCDTWTFQMEYSSAGRDERPADVLQLPSSSFIVCGSDSAAAGVGGRLWKIATDGTVLLGKSLTLGMQQVELHRLRLFTDGRLYGVATARRPDNGNSFPLVFTLDTSSLNVLSVFALNAGSGRGNWRAADIQEGRDRSFFVLSGSDALVNVTKLTYPVNTISWSKTFVTGSKPGLLGIGVEYDYLFAAWNETVSGYGTGVLVSLDFKTGETRYGSRVGGPQQDTHVSFQSLAMVNSRPRIMAALTQNNRQELVRLNYEFNCKINFKEIYSIAGFDPSGLQTRHNSWSNMLAATAATKPNDIYLVNTYTDNYETPIRGWKLHYSSPTSLVGLLLTNDGGSLVLGQSATIPRRLVITKTDSVASLPVCGTEPSASSFKWLQQEVASELPTPHPEVLQSLPTGLSIGDVAVVQHEACRQQFCPVVPEPDSCLRTFFKEYRGYTNSIVAQTMIKLDGGKMLVQFSGRVNPYIAQNSPSLLIIDTAGRLVNARVLSSLSDISLHQIIRLQDGNLLGAGSGGYSVSGPDLFFVKFDQQLNIIWQKKVAATPSYNGVRSMLQSAEGDIFCFLAERDGGQTEQRVLLKLNSQCEPLWLQQFDIGTSIFTGTGEHSSALVEMGKNIVLKYNEEDGDFSPHLTCLRKSDGSMLWTRKYQMEGPYNGSQVFTLFSMLYDGANLLLLGWSQDQNIFLKIGPDGSVVLAKKSPKGVSLFNSLSRNGNDGKLMAGVSRIGFPYSVYGIAEMDTSFRVHRTQFMQIPRNGRLGGLVAFSDSVTYATGSMWHPDPYQASIYFQKYNFNSSFATCAVSDLPLELYTYQQPSSAKTITQRNLALPVASPADAYFSPAYIAYSGLYCGSGPTCTSVELKGPEKICDTTQVYDFKVLRNAGCNGRVVWQLDTAVNKVKVISVSDTLLQLKAASAGSFTLHAKVFGSCQWIEDSITVQATAANNVLNLGPDTTLCEGNTLRLGAGAGFSSYSWQDGTADSVLTVRKPGLYHVSVTTCGTPIRDTILVTAAPPIPFSAGPDRTKCNADTVQLQATSGFLNYTWSNAYNINPTTTAAVVVNPMVDTAYFVQAEKTPGCFAFDTVWVKVYQSSPINLGNDTSFCAGGQVTLRAGGAFVQYLWSTGAATEAISVSNKGRYEVAGTTQEGCTSTDTLQVLEVFANPVVRLDKNVKICTGSAYSFDAGNFSQYLWQDGSTGRRFSAGQTGRYHVQVTDNNGCLGADTAYVTDILPLPAAFLPPDTTICSYGALVLKPQGSFSKYRWSSGQQTANITIRQPGMYWLEVQDAANCIGRDSIIVRTKECMEGLFVPTAFTPNGDGRNDEWKPLLFGNVKSLELVVYNRWGEVVFRTKDRAKGWDGRNGGALQNSGVFVWLCTYELEGQERKQEKGTVMLIR